MWLMYYISVSTVGGWMTDFVNDTLFGDWITNAASNNLQVPGRRTGAGTHRRQPDRRRRDGAGLRPQMPHLLLPCGPGGFGGTWPASPTGTMGPHLPEVQSFEVLHPDADREWINAVRHGTAAYHIPSLSERLIHMWERAGPSSSRAEHDHLHIYVAIWFLSNFSWTMQMSRYRATCSPRSAIP